MRGVIPRTVAFCHVATAMNRPLPDLRPEITGALLAALPLPFTPRQLSAAILIVRIRQPAFQFGFVELVAPGIGDEAFPLVSPFIPEYLHRDPLPLIGHLLPPVTNAPRATFA